MYRKIKILLRYPLSRILTEKYDSLYIVGMAMAIILITNHIQPLGLGIWHHSYKWLIISGYGVLFALMYFVLNQYFGVLFNKFFKTADWTVEKEILNSILFFILIGCINWIYSLLVISEIEASWSSFFRFQHYTMEYYSLPVLSLLLLVNFRFYYRKSMYMESQLKENQKSQTELPLSELIKFFGKTFLRSEINFFQVIGNTVYIHIFHNGKNAKFGFTSSLKQTETMLVAYPEFMKCKSAYIVNTNKLQSYTGNISNTEMKLENCPDLIPVSREKVIMFREIIDNKKTLS
ncbi:MAG: LytTR family DNA-binding domain-containing protein [Paludibacter sp.]